MRLLQSIHDFDVVTFQWCLERRSRALLVSLSRWLSRTADGHLYLLAGLVCTWMGNVALLTILLELFVFERLAYFVLKNRFRRSRPPQVVPGFRSIITPSDQFSFPSGHTSGAFLFTGIICAFYPFLSPLLYGWAVLVGCSRVILGVHFPTDIIAGALLGTSFSLLAYSHVGF